MDKLKKVIKELRWIQFNFPWQDNPENDADKMCNAIHKYTGDAIELLYSQQWISVNDRPPKSGKHVLATCEIRLLNGSIKKYVCEAFHAEEHSISKGKYLDDTDCYDYSEEDDEYYLKEGWYEVIHNWDEYESVVIEDFVTHWMPLPEPPKEGENG